MPEENDILNDFYKPVIFYRNLLPWWMKIFVWLFIVFAVAVPIAIFLKGLGYRFSISLYGLETSDLFSVTGISLIAIFLFKGIVSFMLWTGKRMAVYFGIADALLGIMICSIVMFGFLNNKSEVSFRLELLLLLPYLIKLIKIKQLWINNR